MRILIVEDDEKIAGFIIKGLTSAGFAVDHAQDGQEGLDIASFTSYDLLVVDIMLPRLDGLTLIRSLRGKRVNTPVIILSAKERVDDRVRGLEAGGDDYLTKPFAFSELLARIQALIRRTSGITDPTTLACGELGIDLLKREVVRAGQRIELQPLEYSLLEYLMRNCGRVVSKTMIMEHVWDYNFDPMTNVVEARVCRLRDKVDKGFQEKLIHTVRGAGYIMRSEADT